ncbi:Crp/Fnr family transcriptional regulator [Pseudobdellovibrio sp. HCB154]|uniref:Crp/Fnr family transcriptional regulator n=1 Tax=Pseudobdellovibrio sp. HCB154 TaxID=3386277 RepID=UPI0039170280
MAEVRDIPKDTILFYEGEIPDNMYVVKKGAFDIIKKIDGKDVKVSEAKEGQLIGEMALFDLKPRSATIKANQDSAVVVLPYVNLLDQLEKLPAWVKIVMRTLSDNLRKTTEQLMKK